MIRRIKFLVLLLPLCGIVIGITYAFMFIHGLVVTWHYIGKPADNISRIIGFVGGHDLFVETESGEIYSLEYYNYQNGNDTLPSPIEWKKEEKRSLQPDPDRKPIMRFISVPLLIKVKQVYQMHFQQTEGESLVKFALSEDGDLWMWNYGQGGMAVITYVIFPTIGLIIGTILTLLAKGVIFLLELFTKG